MSTEEWRPIPKYPRYFISTKGRVFDIQKCKYIRPRDDSSRFIIKIRCHGKQADINIKRLVLTLFHRKPRRGEQARFVDENSVACRLDNLMWVAPKILRDSERLRGQRALRINGKRKLEEATDPTYEFQEWE